MTIFQIIGTVYNISPAFKSILYHLSDAASKKRATNTKERVWGINERTRQTLVAYVYKCFVTLLAAADPRAAAAEDV